MAGSGRTNGGRSKYIIYIILNTSIAYKEITSKSNNSSKKEYCNILF